MAWTGSTVETFFARYETATAIQMTNTSAINSDVLGGSEHVLGGNPILVGLTVTVAGVDVAANLLLQYSFDNTNWYTHSTPIADLDPHLTGTKVAAVDLSAIQAPYWRLRFNNNATAVGTAGYIKFLLVGYNQFSNVIAHSLTGT